MCYAHATPILEPKRVVTISPGNSSELSLSAQDRRALATAGADLVALIL